MGNIHRLRIETNTMGSNQISTFYLILTLVSFISVYQRNGLNKQIIQRHFTAGVMRCCCMESRIRIKGTLYFNMKMIRIGKVYSNCLCRCYQCLRKVSPRGKNIYSKVGLMFRKSMVINTPSPPSPLHCL